MRYILFIIILFSIAIQAQDVPSGYTTNLRLRLYDLDDYPGADSLNANSNAIDAGYKRNLDTLNAVKADVYTSINYSGALKNDVVGLNQLNTELDTGLVKTTGTDYVYGTRYNMATQYFKDLMPTTTNSYFLGQSLRRWLYIYGKYVYADNLLLVSSLDTSDVTTVGYDGTKITFDKPVEIDSFTVTQNFAMDSAAALQALKLEPESYVISDVNDTVITATALMSNMQLVLPGDVTRGIETINMTGAAIGHVLIIYTTDADDSVLIQEEADGNLQLDTVGDFWLRSGDNMGFMLMYDQPALTFYWMELWRKDNSD